MADSARGIFKAFDTQAEPLEKASPFRSERSTTPSPSTNSTLTLRFVGRRAGPGSGPFNLTKGIRSRTPSHNRRCSLPTVSFTLKAASRFTTRKARQFSWRTEPRRHCPFRRRPVPAEPSPTLSRKRAARLLILIWRLLISRPPKGQRLLAPSIRTTS